MIISNIIIVLLLNIIMIKIDTFGGWSSICCSYGLHIGHNGTDIQRSVTESILYEINVIKIVMQTNLQSYQL